MANANKIEDLIGKQVKIVYSKHGLFLPKMEIDGKELHYKTAEKIVAKYIIEKIADGEDFPWSSFRVEKCTIVAKK